MSGLLMRLTWPLALMGSADRGPFYFADSRCPRHRSGLLDPRSDPVRHHFTSSLLTRSVSLRRGAPVRFVSREHRPDDASGLVRHGDRDQANGLAFKK